MAGGATRDATNGREETRWASLEVARNKDIVCLVFSGRKVFFGWIEEGMGCSFLFACVFVSLEITGVLVLVGHDGVSLRGCSVVHQILFAVVTFQGKFAQRIWWFFLAPPIMGGDFLFQFS